MLDFKFCPVEWIPMEKLELDSRFNREIVARTITAIDADPDPDKFGALSVASLNGHGKYSIYDGGHRYSWLLENGFEGDVPCVVGRVTEPREVALKFVEMQHDRRDVSPYERYKKLLFAEIEEYINTENAVLDVGWRVGPATANGVVMPSPLHWIYAKSDAAGLSETLELARQTWGARSRATDGNLLKGLHLAIGKLGEVDRNRFVQQLSDTDPSEILVQARARRGREAGTIARNVEREISRAYRSRRSTSGEQN